MQMPPKQKSRIFTFHSTKPRTIPFIDKYYTNGRLKFGN